MPLDICKRPRGESISIAVDGPLWHSIAIEILNGYPADFIHDALKRFSKWYSEYRSECARVWRVWKSIERAANYAPNFAIRRGLKWL